MLQSHILLYPLPNTSAYLQMPTTQLSISCPMIGSVLKYYNFWISQYPLGLSIYHTGHIMELVGEWFPTEKYDNFDTTFRTEYIYKNEIMAEVPLKGNSLKKAELEYNGKFVHTIGQIQNFSFMIIIYIGYTDFCLGT